MNTSTPSTPYSTRGGARIGWVNYTWPLASLSVDAEGLTVVATLFGIAEMGHHRFLPGQVTGIERYGIIPFLGEGIRIRHNVPDYPEKIIFWCRPESVMRGIALSGFPLPGQGGPPPLPPLPRRGFPLRIWPLVLLVLVWNVLFGLDMLSGTAMRGFPGPCSMAALWIVCGISIAVLRLPSLQKVFLHPGRSIGEVRQVFLLTAIVTGFISVPFTLIFIAGGGF